MSLTFEELSFVIFLIMSREGMSVFSKKKKKKLQWKENERMENRKRTKK